MNKTTVKITLPIFLLKLLSPEIRKKQIIKPNFEGLFFKENFKINHKSSCIFS